MNHWDEDKRRITLTRRGLDFADAGLIFEGRTMTLPDRRRDYREARFITAGWLRGRFVVVVWTPRDGGRRIISMRYGHADEEAYYRERLGWAGRCAADLDRDWFERAEISRAYRLIRAAQPDGRPAAAVPTETVNIRLDADVVAHFRATGRGWQSRINAVLRKAAGLGPI